MARLGEYDLQESRQLSGNHSMSLDTHSRTGFLRIVFPHTIPSFHFYTPPLHETLSTRKEVSEVATWIDKRQTPNNGFRIPDLWSVSTLLADL